jgi:pyruvate-formate lyase
MTSNITALHPVVQQAIDFTETYRRHRDDHPALREAACLRAQFPALMGPIEPDDLYAGGWEGGWQAGRMCYVGSIWFAKFAPDRGNTKQSGYCVDFDALARWGQTGADREAIAELESFWLREYTCAKTNASLPPDHPTYCRNDGQIAGGWGAGFCVAIDLDRLVRLGVPGLREQIAQGRRRAQAEGGDVGFFQGLDEALEVFVNVCAHYERQAREQLAAARDDADVARLERIAEGLAAIVERAPETFHEGAQLLWLYDLLVSGKHIEAFRIDVALGDLLAGDLEAGRMTEEDAVEGILGLWRAWSKHGDPAVCRLVIGGKGRRNPDNADRFCAAALEATRRHHGRIPQVTLRFHAEQDPALMRRAFDVIGTGSVFPVLYNDDAIIPGVMRAMGLDETEAEAYHPLGCGEYMLGGRSPSLLNFGWSVPKSLESALRGGVDADGRPLGPSCPPIGDESSIEQLEANLREQIAFSAEMAARCHVRSREVLGSQCAYLLASLLTDDCVARGKSMMDGGARHPGACIMGHGFTNAADALHAIRRLIFEERSVRMSELLAALDADFQGHESLRRKLADVPKYGNDDDEADRELVELWRAMTDACMEAARRHGLAFLTVSSVNPGGYHMGALCGATADGRRAGEPFAIGNAPTAGNDTNGLTGLLNSLSKTDAANGGSASNVKLAKGLFDASRAKLDALFDVYWKRGGIQASVSVVDQAELLDAMEHPDRYPHLLVRLGGWTARFIDLERTQQEEVVRRAIY